MWRRYLAWYLLSLLLLCSLAGAFNALVDPYARILLVDKPGFNQAKITLDVDTRKGKANALRQCEYDTLILGTSRAQTGMATSHPAFSDNKTYNAALRGGTMYEIQRLVDYAIRHQELDTVVLGLDFVSFSAARLTTGDFAESPFAETVPVASMLQYLLSVSTLRASYVTLERNAQGNFVSCRDTGEYTPRVNTVIEDRGAFDFILRRYAKAMFRNYVSGDEPFEHLAALLHELAEADVTIYAYISPGHFIQRELMTEMGLREDYYDWKRQLVQVFDELNSNLPEQRRAVLWDFSGYTGFTAEPVPDAGSGQRMRWHSDSAHFTQDLGNLIIDRIYGRQSAEALSSGDFGVRLTVDNIDVVIAAEIRDSERYRRDNPEEIARMRATLRNAPLPLSGK